MSSNAPSTPGEQRNADDRMDGNVNTGQQHEMEHVSKDAAPTLPVERDIMQLARLGEIAAIQKLFDNGDYDATYRDEENITPLHVGSPQPVTKFNIEPNTDAIFNSGPPSMVTTPSAIS